MTDGVYKQIRDAVEGIWDAGWTRLDVPVYWRSNDADPLPDPSTIDHFFRNEVSFGQETVVASGGGRFATERLQFGSVLIRCFVSRTLQDEDEMLNLLADAMKLYRSVKQGQLSFIGTGSGFNEGPTEDGNWFYRGTLTVFEFRFQG